MVTGCTIVAGNYLAFARVLARSFRVHHPQSRFVVLVIDDQTSTTSDEEFECWGLSDLGRSADDVSVMAAIYSVMEFATALKPWLLTRLLVRYPDAPVVYLDPDIMVYAPLDDIVAPAMTEGIVVTPHVLAPVPRDGMRPNEADLLSAGIYNLGFLAVGPGARQSGFLEFWAERLRRDALVDPSRMQFTDQRWVDFLPMYPHAICRDPGCNVAYWNVWGRPLAYDATAGWSAGGSRLRFYHFSGFDPTCPQVLSRHQGDDARIRLPDHPLLAKLCGDYASAVLDAGHRDTVRLGYGWSTTREGLTLTKAMRRAYRRALLHAEKFHCARPPGPFDVDDGSAFETWLVRVPPDGGIAPLLRGRWETEGGLQALFSDPNGSMTSHFLDWVERHPSSAVAPLDLERLAVDASRARLVVDKLDVWPTRPLSGLNVFGYLDAEMSIGQLARSFAHAAAAAGISVDLVNDPSAHGSKLRVPGLAPGRRWSHDVNVLCVNADRTADAFYALGEEAFAGRRTAGIWSWETSRFPEHVAPVVDRLDEVWVTSSYVARAFEALDRIPRVIVQPVDVPRWHTVQTRTDLELPEGFVVLCVFDWTSVAARKNPLGALGAFRRAFEPGDGAHLVFKTINGDRAWADLDALRLAVGDDPGVRIIDRPVRAWEMTAYLQHADCVLSLHRSEGFGLVLAEAMACATPVIATAYSGNLDFMDDSLAYLVPGDPVAIPDDVPVYGGLGEWAEPDLEAAAEHLVRVRQDREGSRAMAERARRSIAETRNFTVAGRALAAAAQHLRMGGGTRS